MIRTALGLCLLLGGTARAGALYVNGVRADGLRDFSFTDVDVRVDAEGNVWVDAPKYKVSVADGEAPPPQAGQPVAAATWWLVTEDNGSTGHVVDVYVNGEKVKELRSGESQLILDVSPWMRTGTNVVAFHARPGTPGGGVLNLYVGRGSNDGGTLKLDQPAVSWAMRSTSPAGGENKTFEVVVK
jgi:hypothetical protein